MKDVADLIKEADGVVIIALVDGETYLSHTDEFDDNMLLDLFAYCTNMLYNSIDSDIKRKPLH